MELSKRVDGLLREANKLARSAADLVAMAEELQREIGAPAGQEVAQRASPRQVTRPPNELAQKAAETFIRADPVRLDAMVELDITDAWNFDIYQVIEKLQRAGIPAVVRKSNVNGTNYIDVTHGDLIQALTPGATGMKYRWYGAAA